MSANLAFTPIIQNRNSGLELRLMTGSVLKIFQNSVEKGLIRGGVDEKEPALFL